VVPLRRLPGERRDLRRLRRLMRALPAEATPLVVDDTADAALRAETARAVAAHPRGRHLRGPGSGEGPFSIGRLRDAGVEAAGDGPVLFHDVDFLAPPAVYRRLAARAAALVAAPGAFACAPVFFLTPLGSALLRAAPAQIWRRLDAGAAARPPRALVDRLVRGSSAILASRSTLRAVGGHDPAFEGHGAEDFDLMDRLSRRYPMGPRPPAYARDFGSRSTAADGFRAYFARYAERLATEGIFLCHQWHRARRTDPRYHAARRANFELLTSRLNGQAPER
jgi:predicted glycosyltransferase involved in capsule biosynthesis